LISPGSLARTGDARGRFDFVYLACLANMAVMAAADEAGLKHMVATCVAHISGPIALRYPRSEGVGIEMPERGEPPPIGKARVISEGTHIAILSLGIRSAEALKAEGSADAWAVDDGGGPALRQAARPRPDCRSRRQSRSVVDTWGRASGGLGTHALTLLADAGALDRGLNVSTLTHPDRFQDQDKPERLHPQGGLDAAGIAAGAIQALRPAAKVESLRA
jgi:1-deoxy-D-xylulose-5-phosphate synthase